MDSVKVFETLDIGSNPIGGTERKFQGSGFKIQANFKARLIKTPNPNDQMSKIQHKSA